MDSKKETTEEDVEEESVDETTSECNNMSDNGDSDTFTVDNLTEINEEKAKRPLLILIKDAGCVLAEFKKLNETFIIDKNDKRMAKDKESFYELAKSIYDNNIGVFTVTEIKYQEILKSNENNNFTLKSIVEEIEKEYKVLKPKINKYDKFNSEYQNFLKKKAEIEEKKKKIGKYNHSLDTLNYTLDNTLDNSSDTSTDS